VLLVDLDPQGNCTSVLGVKPNGQGTIANLLLGQRPLKECVVSADRSRADGPSRPNLYVVGSDDGLADAKMQVALQGFMAYSGMSKAAVPLEQIFSQALGKAVEVFDYIILDCPPSLDVFEKAVYSFADEAIVPVKVDFLGATGTVQHTENIIAAQAEGIKIKIGTIVPTFVRPRERLAQEVLKALIKRYGKGMVSAPIPQTVSVEQSQASGGLTLYEFAPEHPATKAYEKLVGRVMAS
jgi:chromosome partitioning protein